MEMGASIDVLDLALRIPPWEPMHVLTREEIRSARVATDEPDKSNATVASSPVTLPSAGHVSPIADGLRPTEISEQRWAMIDRSGVAALARSNTLTYEGEEIGDFDLLMSCSADPNSYNVSYVERRHAGESQPTPHGLRTVTITVPHGSVALKIVASERHSDGDELVTRAIGSMPAALVDTFAASGNHSMLIETRSDRVVTGIRVGNTGAHKSLPRLAASCAIKAPEQRAELTVPKANGALAAAK